MKIHYNKSASTFKISYIKNIFYILLKNRKLILITSYFNVLNQFNSRTYYNYNCVTIYFFNASCIFQYYI